MYTLIDLFKDYPTLFWLLIVLIIYAVVLIIILVRIFSWDPKEFEDVKQSKPGETVPESSNNE